MSISAERLSIIADQLLEADRAIIVPHDIAKRSDLMPSSKMLMGLLLRDRRDEHCYLSREFMAREISIGIRTVSMCLRSLETAGLIAYTKTKNRSIKILYRKESAPSCSEN